MAGLSPPGWRGAGSRAGACGSEEDEGEGLCLWGRLAGHGAWAAGPARALLSPCPLHGRLLGSCPRPCHRGCVLGTAALLQLCHLLQASAGTALPVLANK